MKNAGAENTKMKNARVENTKTEEIIAVLEERYPLHTAMDWDNPGLQTGHRDRSVHRVFVALDATDAVIRSCTEWGAQLLITHHPLLMSGIRSVSDVSLTGRKVLALAENGIAHYAIHTNYDVTTMGELAADALKLQQTEILEQTGTDPSGAPCGVGRIGELPEACSAQACCELVKEAFGLSSVRLFGDPKTVVKRIAISPGSGKSMVAPALAAGVQLLVTGDIGHHDGIDAVDNGLLIMDAGHYGIEHIFIAQMADFLEKQFPALQVRRTETEAPFAVL